MGFLRKIMGKKAKQQRESTWIRKAAEEVLKEAGTQSLGAYIDNRQTTVAEWVALRPILEV